MADDAGGLNQVFAETSFLYGANAAFIEELHARWADDPASVPVEWRAFFDQLRDQADVVRQNARAGAWGRSAATEPTEATAVFDGRWPEPASAPASAKGAKPTAGKPAAAPAAAAPALTSAASAVDVRAAAHDSIRALMLIRSFRVRGHLMADLDPLGLHKHEYHPELDPLSPLYGFTEADMDRAIYIAGVLGCETATLRPLGGT
ncbi:MAG: 2-oxoglutarate dehydrogenase E1 subunit family protein, partial [Brevundimonas sp.]